MVAGALRQYRPVSAPTLCGRRSSEMARAGRMKRSAELTEKVDHAVPGLSPAHGLGVATRDSTHFERVAGLRVMAV